MTLHELCAAVPGSRLVRPDGAPPADGPLERIAYRADASGPGALFACLRGVRADGHDFAPEAVARGVSALVCERELALPVAQIVVPDARLAMALIAAELAGRPSRSLTVAAVTGTNGKTTSAYLLRAVLEAAGRPCGLIGTVEGRIGGERVALAHTTPESVDVQDLLARMVAAGDRAVAMEVSSHALAQRRVAGVDVDVALFTNLTRDHLDYHGDMDAYFAAKRLLFRRPPGEGADPAGAANADDPYGRRLVDEDGALGFAVDADAAVKVLRADPSADGTHLEIATPRGRLEVESRLRGRFNASNVAGVVAAGEVLGIAHDAIARGVAAVGGVPGRFEAVDEGGPVQVIVDYAHTPDSLENVLCTARPLAGDGRLITVFGCGGDRDRGKRPQMGALARSLADVAIVTSDNPRTEDPDAIIAEILAGAGAGPAELLVEPDRRRAIARAIEAARAGDLVLIAGKGHEQGQERDGVVTPFDDRDVAREILGIIPACD
jgi:UDP-N-acetylmuramoyl-L-alanyl-D-glutamate--2,6-diaminopimelate ligase